MQQRRLLICDPMCILPFGHAVPAMHHFSTFFQQSFKEIICIGAKLLGSDVQDSKFIRREYFYLYNQFIEVVEPDDYYRDVERFRSSGGLRYQADDLFESIATTDAIRILEDYGVTSDDVLFFPSADFYGVLGIINALSLPGSPRPRVLLRLIGVMELCSAYYGDPQKELLSRVRAALDRSLSISVSAETPAYADSIGRELGCPVLATPYPETRPQIPSPSGKEFVLLCAGSARLDKGYNHLLEIAKAVLPLNLDRPVRIITQSLPAKGTEDWDHYSSQLYAMPNVDLLESYISITEMDELYARCNAVLLPYATDIYMMRGSAVMMEAMAIGRPAIGSKGTAFSKQIEYYGAGSCCEDVGAFTAAIRHWAQVPSDEVDKIMKQSRMRFFADTHAAYRAWVGQI